MFSFIYSLLSALSSFNIDFVEEKPVYDFQNQRYSFPDRLLLWTGWFWVLFPMMFPQTA